VATPAAREAAVEAAQKFVARREPAGIAGVTDPFHPGAFAAIAAQPALPSPGITRPGDPPVRAPADSPGVARVPGAARTDRDILVAIASSLKPKVVLLGGNAILFFGEKKVRSGDPLVITFEGTTYQLTVTTIDRNDFTLRLNREDYTRPIKQGTSP
jgi:hypothetical protein